MLLAISATLGLTVVALSGAPAEAAAKCTSIQAQCAVEIGGRCDPNTGHWEYGNYRNYGSGGTNRGGAFDRCISRKLMQRNKH
jgi:hypothetical protein